MANEIPNELLDRASLDAALGAKRFLLFKHSGRCSISSRAFADKPYEHYAWLREHAPVYAGRISVLRAVLLSRYDDCVAMLKDPRFVRNRGTRASCASRSSPSGTATNACPSP